MALVQGPGRPELDGVSDYVSRLAAALASVGVEAVPVPVLPSGGDHPSARAWWAAVRRAADRIRSVQPDIVHVQFAPSAYRFSQVPGAGLPQLLPRGVPLVTTVHEYGWWRPLARVPEPVWTGLRRIGAWDRETGRLLPSSAAVVATNATHAEEVARRAGRRPEVVPLAPNVDGTPQQATSDRGAVRAALGVPVGATVVVFFGFVHPVKGLRYAIEALPRLVADGNDLHLLVLGGFTSQALPEDEAAAFRTELEDLCRGVGVADRVTFTGYLPEEQVSAALRSADLGLLPFTAGVTTKSGALLTLLAHGLPTAVTVPDRVDHGDPTLVDPTLVDGDTVVLVRERRSTEAVAQALTRLLTDGTLRDRLRAGAARVSAGHRWADVAAAHRGVYERVLHRTGEREAARG